MTLGERRPGRCASGLDRHASKLPDTLGGGAPWEGWDLRFTIADAPRSGTDVAGLHRAIIERGDWRLGPIDLNISWAERIALVGPNGSGKTSLLDTFQRQTGLDQTDARSVLAKFGLGADEAIRATASLSPGERTRARLAGSQALGVNFLVLDEPTNHLDLPAIEQLEAALTAFAGTLLLVSHDRRLLEAIDFDRHIDVTEFGRPPR